MSVVLAGVGRTRHDASGSDLCVATSARYAPRRARRRPSPRPRRPRPAPRWRHPHVHALAAPRGQPRARLGDIVVEPRLLRPRRPSRPPSRQALESGEQIGQVLLERGAITTDQLAIAMAKRFGLDHLSLEDITSIRTRRSWCRSPPRAGCGAVPVSFAGGNVLLVAIANPDNYLGARRHLDVHRHADQAGGRLPGGPRHAAQAPQRARRRD